MTIYVKIFDSLHISLVLKLRRIQINSIYQKLNRIYTKSKSMWEINGKKETGKVMLKSDSLTGMSDIQV